MTAISTELQRIIDRNADPITSAYDLGRREGLTDIRAALSSLPSCFVCGTDSITLPYSVASLRYADAQGLAGIVRAIMTEPLTTPVFSTVGLFGKNYDSELLSATVAICQPCYATTNDLLAGMRDVGTCQGCAESLVSPYSEFPYGLQTFRRNEYDRANVSRIVTAENDVTLRPARTLGDSTFCVPCADARFVCAECDRTLMRAADLSTGVDNCGGCRDAGVRNGYGNGRTICTNCMGDQAAAHATHAAVSSFSATRSLSEALSATYAPGNVITSTRAMGAELETVATRVPDMRTIFATDANGPLFDAIVGDGSIESEFGSFAKEFRGLPLGGSEFERFISTVSPTFSSAGLTGNLSCGLHVHVDHRGMSNKQVWQSYAVLSAVQPVLFGVSDSERWEHSGMYGAYYARPVSNGDIASALRMADRNAYVGDNPSGNRYMAVNAEAHSSHTTLEVRAFGYDVIHRAEFPAVAGMLAGIVDAIADGATTAATLIECAENGVANASRMGDILAALVSGGYIPADSVGTLTSLAAMGRDTMANNAGADEDNEEYDEDEDRSYCGNCCEYVDYTAQYCGCCNTCDNCGHSL